MNSDKKKLYLNLEKIIKETKYDYQGCLKEKKRYRELKYILFQISTFQEKMRIDDWEFNDKIYYMHLQYSTYLKWYLLLPIYYFDKKDIFSDHETWAVSAITSYNTCKKEMTRLYTNIKELFEREF